MEYLIPFTSHAKLPHCNLTVQYFVWGGFVFICRTCTTLWWMCVQDGKAPFFSCKEYFGKDICFPMGCDSDSKPQVGETTERIFLWTCWCFFYVGIRNPVSKLEYTFGRSLSYLQIKEITGCWHSQCFMFLFYHNHAFPDLEFVIARHTTVVHLPVVPHLTV